MIVILKENPEESQLNSLIAWLETQRIHVHPTVGANQTILGLVGDTSRVDMDMISSLDIVEAVKRVQEPFKNVNRKFHPDDTIIRIGDTEIGGKGLTIIAGAGMLESREQLFAVAEAAKKSGVSFLRGSVFGPRSSPYSYQGMRVEGIRLLLEARETFGIPVISEIMDASQLPLFEDIDILQVGSRNMQNYSLLKALGKTDKTVLLKRNMSATYEDLLMSAEYLLAGGNRNVILCERGIRTFETHTRSTIDISAVPVLKQLSHLPVLVDPGDAVGRASLVPPIAQAAVAAGADGVVVQVHGDAGQAGSGSAQAVTPSTLTGLTEKLNKLKAVLA